MDTEKIVDEKLKHKETEITIGEQTRSGIYSFSYAAAEGDLGYSDHVGYDVYESEAIIIYLLSEQQRGSRRIFRCVSCISERFGNG